MSLPEALERAASALEADADAIRPANGDPARLLAALAPDARERVLGWLLREAPGASVELADAWADEEAGRAALLAIDDAGLPKAARKVLRRVRHRLRSQGVAVPEAAPAPTVAHLPALEEALDVAFASRIDPSGARQVWWTARHPSAGMRVFEAVIDAARGVLRFEVYKANRSDVRQFMRRLEREGAAEAVALDVETAQALVHAAAASPVAGKAPPRWIEWRSRLAAGAATLPGETVRAALGVPEGREALDAVVRLVAESEIGPWPPDRDVLERLVERLRGALESPIVVSGAAKREQVSGLVEEAAAEVFGGPAGEIAAGRLREMAYLYWRRGDMPRAEACLAGAASFEADAGASVVARAFVERWLAPFLAAGESAEAEAPSEADTPLLVKP